MRTSIPGVTIASTAHIVNGTQNVNEVLDLARVAVAQMTPDLDDAPAALATRT